VNNGYTLTYVNMGARGKLRTLSAKVNGVSTASSYSAASGTITAVAHGRFVTVNLTVTNRLDSPQQFDGGTTGQVALSVRGKTYTPSFDAENEADQSSFMSANNSAPIQPGESQSGDVVFDVPSTAVNIALAHGAVIVTDFGTGSQAPTNVLVLKIF
jgi:hypothetical protein